ncbi:MAG: HU family DNA-binding protein [Vicinamibacteria bacterium]|jgi:DNA-binding protein HU-beta|nr:HU family DNA-binding protein [Vicinamibacteria bacterium]
MNKAELVTIIAKDASLTKTDVTKVLDALIDTVTRSLKKNERVTLVGFGTFGVSKRKARTGRNPQTLEPIKIAARRVPKFTAGKELKAAIR